MESRMEQFPEKNPNPVLSVAKEGTVLYSNEASKPLLNEWGVRVGEKLPSNIVDLVQRVIALNNLENLEVKVGKRVFLVAFHPLPEDECVNIYGFDISDRKKLEEELRESKDQYRMLFDHSMDGIIQTDPRDRGKILAANPAACRMLGWTEEELIGKGRDAILDLQDPSLSSLLDERVHSGPARAQITYKRKDGTTFPGEVSTAFFIDNSGEPRTVAIIRDITKSKQEEHRIRRYNLIIEGINRIFSNVVQAKTEEELGNTCLSVALKVTGCGVGFVGEVGVDGLLHDIAISDMGWNQCTMYNKTGHQHPPGDFVLHGLYGNVIDSGKGFFTNDPQSHPSSIGLPHGHPPLTSFLRVPLIQDGKTIGMIAVANREGGYSNEQLEDLEAIAPAVTQALKRKREEKERRQAEKEVAEQARLLNLSYDAILIRDSMDRISYWNLGAQEVYGYTKEEVLGCTPHELLKTEFPQPLEDIFEMLYHNGRWTGELNHTHKDGRKIAVITRWILDRDTQGNPASILEVNSDISERKQAEESLLEAYKNLQVQSEELQAQAEELQAQSEELQEANEALHESEDQFSALVKNVKSGVALVDETGRFTVVNPSFMRMFGLNNELNILNINSQDWSRWEVYGEDGKLLHVDDHPIRKVVMTGNPVKDQLVAVRNPGANKLTWMLISAEPILKEDGHIYRVICTYHDITERKKAEEDLKRAHDNLEEKVKERTEELEKAYNSLKESETARKQEIHHRIKNNLQVISSLLDLQAEQFKDKEYITDSEVLKAFRESQARVISMALIHEELYKGGGFETLNFAPYIKELAENLLHTYSVGNSDISLKLDLAENAFFDMDIAVPLGMIVNELVTNSFKHAFSGRNKGEIQIKLSREENGECINCKSKDCESTSFALTVSDNGIGIAEDLDIENTDTLGMQLVTSLVDQLDGELKLKRVNGTEFTIRFTVTEKNNQEQEAFILQLIDND